MYKYETHLHTKPVSACAGVTVCDNLEFYKKKGYDGVFITNHFLDGNIGIDKSLPYEIQLDFYFLDYYTALEIGKKIGIKVFLGLEMSYGGTDFLVYGLEPQWYYNHPSIMDMKKSEELNYLRGHGAFISQAHPFREAFYIDHIRLFPRCVDAVETINAGRTEFENKMADMYADMYGLPKTAGSDNHRGKDTVLLAGMQCSEPIEDERDFIRKTLEGKLSLFCEEN